MRSHSGGLSTVEGISTVSTPAEDAELTADDTKTEENTAAFNQQPLPLTESILVRTCMLY